MKVADDPLLASRFQDRDVEHPWEVVVILRVTAEAETVGGES